MQLLVFSPLLPMHVLERGKKTQPLEMMQALEEREEHPTPSAHNYTPGGSGIVTALGRRREPVGSARPGRDIPQPSASSRAVCFPSKIQDLLKV